MAKKYNRYHLSNAWWEILSEVEKLKCRSKYEELRKNNTQRFPYPNMGDTMNSKISQLTDRQIYNIFRFLASMEWHCPWSSTEKEREKIKFSNRY